MPLMMLTNTTRSNDEWPIYETITTTMSDEGEKTLMTKPPETKNPETRGRVMSRSKLLCRNTPTTEVARDHGYVSC